MIQQSNPMYNSTTEYVHQLTEAILRLDKINKPNAQVSVPNLQQIVTEMNILLYKGYSIMSMNGASYEVSEWINDVHEILINTRDIHGILRLS